MEREEEIKELERKIVEVKEGTDWAWWLLIAASVLTMIVALVKIV